MKTNGVEYIKIAEPPDNIERFVMKCGFGTIKEQDAIIATGEWWFICRDRNVLLFNDQTHEVWTITPLVAGSSGRDTANSLVDEFMQMYDLLNMYRKKRRVDGLNGRAWNAPKHKEYDDLIEEAEQW